MENQKSKKKFLDDGSPLVTIINIPKANVAVKITNPEKLATRLMPVGSYGRIQCRKGDNCVIWILELNLYHTIFLEIHQFDMYRFFKQHEHNIFLYFA